MKGGCCEGRSCVNATNGGSGGENEREGRVERAEKEEEEERGGEGRSRKITRTGVSVETQVEDAGRGGGRRGRARSNR